MVFRHFVGYNHFVAACALQEKVVKINIRAQGSTTKTTKCFSPRKLPAIQYIPNILSRTLTLLCTWCSDSEHAQISQLLPELPKLVKPVLPVNPVGMRG